MIIAIWLLLRILFISLAVALLLFYIRSIKADGSLNILVDSIKSALKDCGFHLRNDKNYPIELYKWTINENDEICEESLDRATWPAMDIADWMKEGLPRSSDGSSLCGRDCRCKLTRFKVKRTRQQKSL